jgi:DNA-binding MarR family transcriptional regulator
MQTISPELDMLDDIIGRCVAARTLRAARVVTRQYDQALAEHGITITQFTLMVAIGRHRPHSLTKLAEGLDIERSTLSRNIAKLRAGGFVETKAVGRSQELSLTEKGAAILKDVYPKWRDVQTSIEEKLGDPALARMREALKDLHRI